MLISEPLPASFYEQFHSGGNWDLFSQCADCGGCEYTLIGSLLPGEANFIAEHLKLTPEEFSYNYIDYIKVGDIHHEVLRLARTCPFLDKHGACIVREFKPLLCAVYPFTFTVESTAGAQRVIPQLDSWCPLAESKAVVTQFQSVLEGMSGLLRLINPVWIESLETFDPFMFDFDNINRNHRKGSGPLYIDVETLLQYKIENIPAKEVAKRFNSEGRSL